MLTRNKLSLLKDAACVVLSFSILANCCDGSFAVYKANASTTENTVVVFPLMDKSIQVINTDNTLLDIVEGNGKSILEDEYTILSCVTQANLSNEELKEVVQTKISGETFTNDLEQEKEEQASEAKENSDKAVYEASLVKNPNMVIELTYDELDLLERLVECEAGNQDMIGRILVANTIINRYNSPKFPNNISEIILWPGQYSPVSSGSINRYKASDMSKEAVQRALSGEDYSKNAYYFMNRRYSCASSIRWFDTLPKVVEHQDHEFFTEY